MVELYDYRARVKTKKLSVLKWFKELQRADCKYYIGKHDWKTALKKAEKEVSTLEAKKAKADAKAAEEAKKIEAEAVLKKLLASGMSADEILEKLK